MHGVCSICMHVYNAHSCGYFSAVHIMLHDCIILQALYSCSRCPLILTINLAGMHHKALVKHYLHHSLFTIVHSWKCVFLILKNYKRLVITSVVSDLSHNCKQICTCTVAYYNGIMMSLKQGHILKLHFLCM